MSCVETACRRRALRLAVVDDHPVVRSSLVQLVQACGWIEVVAQGASGRDAIDIVRDHRLDVLVLDLFMPGQSGLDALAHLKAIAPRTGVLILSGHPEQHYALNLLRAGASGYLCKSCEPGEIVAAIREIAAGRLYITPPVADLLASEVIGSNAPHEHLTEREFQVLLRLAEGQACSHIAVELSLSPKTVSTYRARLMAKIGLHTNAEVTYYAIKAGLVA